MLSFNLALLYPLDTSMLVCLCESEDESRLPNVGITEDILQTVRIIIWECAIIHYIIEHCV